MRWLLLVIVLVAPAAFAEKNFVYCSSAAPGSFNPQQSADQPTFIATTATIYDRLLNYPNPRRAPEGSLAESWTISKDRKTYTFKLRHGVRFQTIDTFKPTRAMNSDDVVFSFERWREKDAGFMNGAIKKVVKAGPDQVKFILHRPHSPFLADLAQAAAVILSKEYADQLSKASMASTLNSVPVGTGPFILKRYIKDTSIHFEANPEYWRGRAKLDKLTIKIVPSREEREALFRKGECHVFDGLISDMPGILSIHQSAANIAYLAFNTEKSPFNRVEVRRAIAAAFDKLAYVYQVYGGQAAPAWTAVPPVILDSALEAVPSDAALAKQALAKAGFPEGIEAELWTLPLARPYLPDPKKLGTMMQADLALAGVKVRLVTFDWPTYLEKTRAGEFQMAQLGWVGESPDPDGFLGTLLTCDAVKSGMNVARWCNKQYDRWIAKAREATEPKARTDAYSKAMGIFAEELPWVPIAHATVIRAVQPNVIGYHTDPFGLEDFYALDLKL